jgi:hypothetical protein
MNAMKFLSIEDHRHEDPRGPGNLGAVAENECEPAVRWILDVTLLLTAALVSAVAALECP